MGKINLSDKDNKIEKSGSWTGKIINGIYKRNSHKLMSALFGQISLEQKDIDELRKFIDED